MVRDAIIMAGVVIAFATLVTVHVSIAFGLWQRSPRWRAPVAFLVAPLAPWWALQEKMRVRAVLWAVACVVYAAALRLAL